MVGAKGCERFALHQDLVPFSFKSSSKRHFASSFGLFCFNILDCQHGFLPFCNPETTSNKLEGMTVSPLFVTFICMRLASVGNTVVPFLQIHFSHGKLTRAFVFFRLRLLPYSPQSTHHYKDGSRWKRCCWVRGGWRNWRRWRSTLELFPDTINRYVTLWCSTYCTINII